MTQKVALALQFVSGLDQHATGRHRGGVCLIGSLLPIQMSKLHKKYHNISQFKPDKFIYEEIFPPKHHHLHQPPPRHPPPAKKHLLGCTKVDGGILSDFASQKSDNTAVSGYLSALFWGIYLDLTQKRRGYRLVVRPKMMKFENSLFLVSCTSCILAVAFISKNKFVSCSWHS